MQYINNMRGIAILMIIASHAMMAPGAAGGITPFLSYLVGNGTIVFVFIAGYLFPKTTGAFRYGPYLANKAKTIVLPYLVTSFPVTIGYLAGWAPSHRFMDLDWYYSLDLVSRYLFITVTGGALGPLWFIPMIVLFYVASPVFNLLKTSPLLLPMFVVTLFAACLIGRSSSANALQNFVYFAPAYVLGMIVSRCEDWLAPVVPYAPWLLIGYVAIESALFQAFFTEPESFTNAAVLLLNLPLSVLLMLWCRQGLNRRIPALGMFARLSLFLYFIHGYFAGIMRTTITAVVGTVPVINNPFLDLAAIALATFIIISASLTVFVALKLITRDKSRFLIGA